MMKQSKTVISVIYYYNFLLIEIHFCMQRLQQELFNMCKRMSIY